MSQSFITEIEAKSDTARASCATEIKARASSGGSGARRRRSLLSIKALAGEKRSRRHGDTSASSTLTTTTTTHTHTTSTSYDYFADDVQRLAAALASGAQTNITFSNGDEQYASCNEVCADQKIQATRVRVRTMVVTSNPQSAQCASADSSDVAGTRGTLAGVYGTTCAVTIMFGGLASVV
jgi:hypothetical protein